MSSSDTPVEDPEAVDTARRARDVPFVAPLPVPVERLDGGVPARRPDPPDPNSVPGYLRLWRWWLGKAANIARVQNRVFAWLAYHLGLFWVAMWFRVTRQDRLDRTPRPVGASEWHKRDPVSSEPRRASRPF